MLFTSVIGSIFTGYLSTIIHDTNTWHEENIWKL